MFKHTRLRSQWPWSCEPESSSGKTDSMPQAWLQFNCGPFSSQKCTLYEFPGDSLTAQEHRVLNSGYHSHALSESSKEECLPGFLLVVAGQVAALLHLCLLLHLGTFFLCLIFICRLPLWVLVSKFPLSYISTGD